MNDTYRGFAIRLERGASWRATIVETQTGALLPTMATALMHEGADVALRRARKLVDIYADALDMARAA